MVLSQTLAFLKFSLSFTKVEFFLRWNNITLKILILPHNHFLKFIDDTLIKGSTALFIS